MYWAAAADVVAVSGAAREGGGAVYWVGSCMRGTGLCVVAADGKGGGGGGGGGTGPFEDISGLVSEPWTTDRI